MNEVELLYTPTTVGPSSTGFTGLNGIPPSEYLVAALSAAKQGAGK